MTRLPSLGRLLHVRRKDDVPPIEPEVRERTLLERRCVQPDMLLQPERRPELQCRIAVGEAGQVIDAVLQQTDKLTRLKMLQRIHPLLGIDQWCCTSHYTKPPESILALLSMHIPRRG